MWKCINRKGSKNEICWMILLMNLEFLQSSYIGNLFSYK